MRRISLTESHFHGAVSVQQGEGWMKPWRVPYSQAELFQPDCINGKGQVPAGVNVALRTNSRSVRIDVVPGEQSLQFDCLVDGKLSGSAVIAAGDSSLTFDNLGAEPKEVRLYLSQKHPVQVAGVWLDDESQDAAVEDGRPKWIAYGSSITQCSEAAGPSRTWPALAASKLNLNLTCLGYGGNCHMEPMVARMIRDLPADFISLCVGINIMGGATLSPRTFKPALIGFVETIRDNHPDTPLALMSPIYCPHRESTDNAVGFSLQKMREHIRDVYELYVSRGDRNIVYIDGLDLFGEQFASYLPDNLHPNAEGYAIMAERFSELAAAKLPMFQRG